MKKPRKILVCAQAPPPLHGQSVMVKHFLDSLQATPRWEVIHLNLQLSNEQNEIGKFKLAKCFRLFRYWWNIRRIMRREKPEIFYYVPAPPRPSALLRDFILLQGSINKAPRRILHWHAYGMGSRFHSCFHPMRHFLKWRYRKSEFWIISHRLLPEVAPFKPASLSIVPNGIPDPFPHSDIISQRQNRVHDRDNPFTFLFLSSLTEAKGVITAIETVQLLASVVNKPLRLILAGSPPTEKDARQLQSAIANSNVPIERAGFVEGDNKSQLLLTADTLLFPSRYPFEGAPLIILEALAAALPVVTTSWRGIPGLLPPEYPWILPHPDAFLSPRRLQPIFEYREFPTLRQHFLNNFSFKQFQAAVKKALVKPANKA